MKRIALFSLLLLTATQSVAKAEHTTAGQTATVDTASRSSILKARAAATLRSLGNKRIAALAVLSGGCCWGVYEQVEGDGVVPALKSAKDKVVNAACALKELISGK